MYSEYIEKVLKEVTDKGYKVAYIGVISQFNYGLETENSDYVDIKVIVYPDFHNIMLRYTNDKHKSEYIYFPDLECEIINLIDFGYKLYKIQLPYLEVLFSKYYYKDPMFDRDSLQSCVNRALNVNMKKLAKSIYKVMDNIFEDYKFYIRKSSLDINSKETYKVIVLYHLFKNFNYNKNFGESLMMKEDLDKINNHILCNLSKKQAYVDCTMYTFKMKKFVYSTMYDEDEVKGISLGYIKFQTIDMYYSYLKSLILNQESSENDNEIESSENDNEIESSENVEIESSENVEIESSENDNEIESSENDNEIESSDNAIAKLLMKIGIIMTAILLITC